MTTPLKGLVAPADEITVQMRLHDAVTIDLPVPAKWSQELFRAPVVATFCEQNVELSTSTRGAQPSGVLNDGVES